MNKKLKLILIISFCFGIFSIIYAKEQKISVLFLSSYSPSFPTFSNQVDGIREILTEEIADIQIEYLDTKQYPEGEIHDLIEETIAAKLKKDLDFDLVLTADDNALHFIEKYYDKLFKSIPVVFFGVNDEIFAKRMGVKYNISGLTEDISIKENLELIESLYTDKTLYIISDGTTSGSVDLERVMKHISESAYSLKTIVINLNDYTWTEFENKLKLTAKNPILLLSAYKDKENVNKDFEESLEIIKNSGNLSVFHLWRHGISSGLLGGNVVNHHEYAKQAARIGQFIVFYNKNPHLEVQKAENVYLINYETMKELNLHDKQFPKSTTFINAPSKKLDGFLLKNIYFITLIVLILILTFFLIFQIKKIVSEEKEIAKVLYENDNEKEKNTDIE